MNLYELQLFVDLLSVAFFSIFETQAGGMSAYYQFTVPIIRENVVTVFCK